MPSITFQAWEDRIAVTALSAIRRVRIIAQSGTNEGTTEVIATPNEARKLATMLNEMADRAEDDG